MNSKMSVAVAVLVSLASTSAATAQSCLGQLSLQKVHINGAANVHMVNQAKAYEGRVAVGNAHPFASAGFGVRRYKNNVGKANSYLSAVEGGYTVAIPHSGVNVCPVVSFGYQNGPDNSAITQSQTNQFYGISVGGAARISSTLALVPFFGAGYQAINSRERSVATSQSYNGSEHGTGLQGGLGLQIRDHYLLRAAFHKYDPRPSQSLGTSQDSFTVGMSFSPSVMR